MVLSFWRFSNLDVWPGQGVGGPGRGHTGAPLHRLPAPRAPAAPPPPRQRVAAPGVVQGPPARLETGARVAVLALAQLRSPVLPWPRSVAGVLLDKEKL